MVESKKNKNSQSNDGNEPETEHVMTRQVHCDGGKLGHPRVYINLGLEGKASCDYCNKQFIYKK